MTRARWLAVVLSVVLSVALAVGALGCVPTPAGRAEPSDSGPPSTVVPRAESTPEISASAAAAASQATTSGQPSFVRPTPNPSPTFLVHEVRAGENLTSIARLYGTTARSIAYWNRDRYPSLDPDSPDYEPNRIEVGWVLQLIPTEVVDEDELPDPTPTATPEGPSPGASSSPG